VLTPSSLPRRARPVRSKLPKAKIWPAPPGWRSRQRSPTEPVQTIEPLLSLQQAAEASGISASTLGNRVRAGTLPAVKLAGKWRVRLSDLDDHSTDRH
jgi:excisionase family DNA binding protein